MTTTVLLIGLTKSDRQNDYSSFDDGYRPGAAQSVVRVTVTTDEFAPTAVEWAEAVFEAMNAPFDLTGPARLVQEELTRLNTRFGVRMRSLSVGDTVTIAGDPQTGTGGTMLACDAAGWVDVLNELAPFHGGDDDLIVPSYTQIRIANPDEVDVNAMPVYEGNVRDAYAKLKPGTYTGVVAERDEAIRLVVAEQQSFAEYDTGR